MSAGNSTASELPNAFTPLAFLDPTLANQFEVSRYLYAITLGICIWDIATNLDNDRVLLFKQRIHFSTIVYYLSRISALCYVITSFAFQVGRIGNCQALQFAIGVTYTTSEALTSLLFFIRVRAVYNRNKSVQLVFFLLWLAAAGGAITVPVGIKGAHIGPTQQCINTVIPVWLDASASASLVNDSAVFIAITYRILTFNIVEETFKARARVFFGKGSVPRLSRSLLLGGQHYYFVALCGNLLVLVIVLIPGVPPVYQGMFSVPVIALTNLMACIVFRKIKFGHISDDGTTFINGTYSAGAFHAHDLSVPRYRVGQPPLDDASFATQNVRGPLRAVHVDISKSTETDAQSDIPLKDLKAGVDSVV